MRISFFNNTRTTQMPGKVATTGNASKEHKDELVLSRPNPNPIIKAFKFAAGPASLVKLSTPEIPSDTMACSAGQTLAKSGGFVGRAAAAMLLGVMGVGLVGCGNAAPDPYKDALVMLQKDGAKFWVSYETTVGHLLSSSSTARVCYEESSREVLRGFNSNNNGGVTILPDAAQKDLTSCEHKTIHFDNPAAVQDYFAWKAGALPTEPWVGQAMASQMSNIKGLEHSAAPVFELIEGLHKDRRFTYVTPGGTEIDMVGLDDFARLEALYGSNASGLKIEPTKLEVLKTLDNFKTPGGKVGTGHWFTHSPFDPLKAWKDLEKGQEVHVQFRRPKGQSLDIVARNWDELSEISQRAQSQYHQDTTGQKAPKNLENATHLRVGFYYPGPAVDRF